MADVEALVFKDDSANEATWLSRRESRGTGPVTRKFVTWKQVEDASENLLDEEEALMDGVNSTSYSRARGMSVPLILQNDDAKPNRCVECSTGCFSSMRTIFVECLTVRSAQKRRVKKVTTLNGMQGHLWKLNGEVDHKVFDTPEVTDIKNWRRRFFLVRDRNGKLAMMYVSEKNDGEMTLACALGVLGTQVSVKAINPPIDLRQLTPRTSYWARSNFKSYDVAFGFDNKLHNKKDLSAYDEFVPQQLYPFTISWQDSNGVAHQLVIAAADEDIRVMWISHIEESVRKILTEPPAQKAPRPAKPKRKR